jgi:hypothetical protein
MAMSIFQAKVDYNGKKIKGYLVKKIFPLQSDAKKPERVVEAIKHEIRKYLKRERNKKLPEGAPFWIFECRVGKSEESAKEFLVQELISAIDTANLEKWNECFVEIVAKPAKNLQASPKKA